MHTNSSICEALKRYPLANGEKLSFESGEISAICRPFVNVQRKDLDRCGDTSKDPYTSMFTWASRSEMSKRGKVNLYSDQEAQPLLEPFLRRINELKESASQLCCGSDEGCKKSFQQVEISLCRPQDDPNKPDPCVFGGSYKMSGQGYSAIFHAIEKVHGGEMVAAAATVATAAAATTDANEWKRLIEKNLASSNDSIARDEILRGDIVLSSYVPKSMGTSALEPVVLHEFGHACSMVRMQRAALATDAKSMGQAIRAARWLDSARNRCQANMELPEAYFDFWESLGESRQLASCLYRLTTANQKNQIDRPCTNLCPGHYLEESAGIAFSLLLGDAKGLPASVFPNTCDHVRDGQHPLVSDVAECLAQNSPRFREKLKSAYGCG